MAVEGTSLFTEHLSNSILFHPLASRREGVGSRFAKMSPLPYMVGVFISCTTYTP